jgi:small conductance mechanosensitive channel
LALRVAGGGLSERYLGAVAPRPRVLAFGSAAALVVAGSISALLVGGLTGEVLAIGLITLGLGAVVLLLFLEVGLSEERALATEEKRRRQRAKTMASVLRSIASIVIIGTAFFTMLGELGLTLVRER